MPRVSLEKNLRNLAMLIAAASVMSAASAPAAEPEGVAWIDDPQRALQIARQTGKPVVAFVSSPRCGFCTKMERETWSDPAIARVVAEHYVPLRLKTNRHPGAVRSLRVRVFPTTVVIDHKGNGVNGAAGFLPPERLAELLSAAPSPDAVAGR